MAPGVGGISNGTMPELVPLSLLVEEKPENFASGSDDIQAAALQAAKYLFDISVTSESASYPLIQDLLSSISPTQAPKTRLSAAKEQSPSDAGMVIKPSPVSSLFVEGMDDEQIWAQLDLRVKVICDLLDFALGGEISHNESGSSNESEDEGIEDDDNKNDEALRQAYEEYIAGEGVDFSGLEDLDFDDGVSSESEEAESEDGDDDDEDYGEGIVNLRGDDSEEERAPPTSTLRGVGKPLSSMKRRKSELDDGFFNLAEFNADAEGAEARSRSKGRLAGDESSDDDDDMSVDLFAPIDDREMTDDVTQDEPILYKDFFEAPSTEAPSTSQNTNSGRNSKQVSGKTNQVRFHEEVRVKKIRRKGKNLPLNGNGLDQEESSDEYEDESIGSLPIEDEEEDSDNEAPSTKAIERLKEDLFAEEQPIEELTTHGRRMAALRDQIQDLESQNVAAKEWMLMGEAGSRARPQNSLLEEDLDFDRVMKAVPVVTEEVVQALEEKIKARIAEDRFDDVVRLRAFEDKPFLPSRFLELQDTKSSKSLAQIYESDYVAAQAGGTSVDDRDGKLKKEHDEIEQQWEKICNKLDSLCNAHFIPKAPKAVISSMSNVSTATLESALPTTRSASTILAPEEVFSPATSAPRARSEMTPIEKRSLRGKERKARKRQRDAMDKTVDKLAKMRSVGGVKKQKQAALDSVVKHGKGVTVVGKKSKDVKKVSKHRT